jgi:hypothetical protein
MLHLYINHPPLRVCTVLLSAIYSSCNKLFAKLYNTDKLVVYTLMVFIVEIRWSYIYPW